VRNNTLDNCPKVNELIENMEECQLKSLNVRRRDPKNREVYIPTYSSDEARRCVERGRKNIKENRKTTEEKKGSK